MLARVPSSLPSYPTAGNLPSFRPLFCIHSLWSGGPFGRFRCCLSQTVLSDKLHTSLCAVRSDAVHSRPSLLAQQTVPARALGKGSQHASVLRECSLVYLRKRASHARRGGTAAASTQTAHKTALHRIPASSRRGLSAPNPAATLRGTARQTGPVTRVGRRRGHGPKRFKALRLRRAAEGLWGVVVRNGLAARLEGTRPAGGDRPVARRAWIDSAGHRLPADRFGYLYADADL